MASARRVAEHASSGGVSATLTYRVLEKPYRHLTRPFLTIRRDGVVEVARPLRADRRDTGRAFPPQPANYYGHVRSVSVRNIDSDREPEVLVDL